MAQSYRNVLDKDISGYIELGSELLAYLKEKYGRRCGEDFDFHVANRNDRWYFYGPEELSENELRDIVNEIVEGRKATPAAPTAVVTEAAVAPKH